MIDLKTRLQARARAEKQREEDALSLLNRQNSRVRELGEQVIALANDRALNPAAVEYSSNDTVVFKRGVRQLSVTAVNGVDTYVVKDRESVSDPTRSVIGIDPIQDIVIDWLRGH